VGPCFRRGDIGRISLSRLHEAEEVETQLRDGDDDEAVLRAFDILDELRLAGQNTGMRTRKRRRPTVIHAGTLSSFKRRVSIRAFFRTVLPFTSL